MLFFIYWNWNYRRFWIILRSHFLSSKKSSFSFRFLNFLFWLFLKRSKFGSDAKHDVGFTQASGRRRLGATFTSLSSRRKSPTILPAVERRKMNSENSWRIHQECSNVVEQFSSDEDDLASLQLNRRCSKLTWSIDIYRFSSSFRNDESFCNERFLRNDLLTLKILEHSRKFKFIQWLELNLASFAIL